VPARNGASGEADLRSRRRKGLYFPESLTRCGTTHAAHCRLLKIPGAAGAEYLNVEHGEAGPIGAKTRCHVGDL